MPRDLRRRLEEHLQCNLRQSGSSPSSKFDARQDTDRGRLYGCRLPVGGGRSTCIKVQSCLVVIVVTSAPPIPFGSKNGAFTCGFAYVQPHVFDYAADVRPEHHWFCYVPDRRRVRRRWCVDHVWGFRQRVPISPSTSRTRWWG